MKANASKRKHPFSADRAIEKISQDRLGRSFFASNLADAVCSWKEKDSLVLALYGEWGVGKTSVKNLFKRHCKDKGDPYIVEFNPWQWSAQEKIFEAFFQLIGERLGRKDIPKEAKHLAKKWKYFAASWGIGAEIVKDIQNAGLQFLALAAVSAWLATFSTGIISVIIRSLSLIALLIAGLATALPSIFEKVTALFEQRPQRLRRRTPERRRPNRRPSRRPPPSRHPGPDERNPTTSPASEPERRT